VAIFRTTARPQGRAAPISRFEAHQQKIGMIRPHRPTQTEGALRAFKIKVPAVAIGDIMKATSLRRKEVYDTLGWLGRENKIDVEVRGRAKVFSLQP
jgi:hypothetical protein